MQVVAQRSGRPSGELFDDALIAGAQAGDQDKLHLLIQRLHPLIVRYCRARVDGRERAIGGADDIAQEICMAVISALPTFRSGQTPFLAFVYGIAGHKVADAYRNSARVRSIPVPDVPDRPAADHTPEQHVLLSDAAQTISELLDALPEQQREILRLRVVVGLSAEQTAEMLSMSAGAVRVAQHRALGKLRGILTAAGEAPVDSGGWAEVTG